jgi:carboxylesterase
MSAPILPGAEPVSLTDGSRGGVLLLHGYMGTVQTVRAWAMAFAQAGFAVEAPLLPGHGTSPEDMLDTKGWNDYVNCADIYYRKLEQQHKRVFVGGLCLGGPIAAAVVTRHPETAGLISINGNFQLPTQWNADYLRQMLKDNRLYFPWFRGKTAEDPQAPPLIVYELAPIAPMLTLRPALEELYPRLGEIYCPVLAFTSRLDTVLAPGEDEPLWIKEVSGPVEHIFLERSRHLATIDYDKEIVEARSVAFALANAKNVREQLPEEVA